jgi:hypothetical protein
MDTANASGARLSKSAIASLFLAILSFLSLLGSDWQTNSGSAFVTALFAAASIALGCRARKRFGRPNAYNRNRVIAATGAVGGSLTLMLLAILLVVSPPLTRSFNQKRCQENLRQIGFAVRIWSGDNNGSLPARLLDMTNELNNPKVVLCLADPVHKAYGPPRFGTIADIDINWNVWNATNISYEFLAPGLSLDTLSNRPIIRCPIHGYELFGDGSVHKSKLEN